MNLLSFGVSVEIDISIIFLTLCFSRLFIYLCYASHCFWLQVQTLGLVTFEALLLVIFILFWSKVYNRIEPKLSVSKDHYHTNICSQVKKSFFFFFTVIFFYFGTVSNLVSTIKYQPILCIFCFIYLFIFNFNMQTWLQSYPIKRIWKISGNSGIYDNSNHYNICEASSPTTQSQSTKKILHLSTKPIRNL